MSRTSIRKKILGLILVALVVTCTALGLSWVQPSKGEAKADGVSVAMGDGSVRFISHSIHGLAYGEAIRFCFGSASNLIHKENSFAKLRVELFDRQGNSLLLRELVNPAFGFSCMDVLDTEIPGVREPTSRIEFMGEEIITLPEGLIIDMFLTLEVFDLTSGKTKYQFRPQASKIVLQPLI